MAPSRRQIFTVISGVYLVALVALGAYALNKIKTHSLPIPTSLGAFTLALPAIAGLSLEALTGSAPGQRSTGLQGWAPRFGAQASLSQYSIVLLFVYETVLATLAGTYLTPVSSLRCGLDDRWKALYRAKDGKAILRIQEAFRCCGLHSSRDMAYPFPGGGRGADACEIRYDRNVSCFERWRDEQMVVAAVLLAVTAGVAAWKILVICLQTRRAPWFEGSDAAAGNSSERHALEGPDAEAPPYRDQPDVEDIDGTDGEVASRVVPPRLGDDSAQWADQRST